MISSRPYFRLLNITLEAMSAHAIHTGHGDTTHDSLVVRDANGLPTLIGTSLAGILRHHYSQTYGQKASNMLFGYADGSEGQTSWLTVSWGLVHNSENKPQEGLLTAQQLDDVLLAELLKEKPIVRQRVRLTDKGVAKESGKFDVTLIPAGVRYTARIHYWCDGSSDSEQQWKQFVELLTQKTLRIGKGIRQGYGLFKIVALHKADWNLTTSEGREAYQNRSHHRADITGLTELQLHPQQQGVFATIKLTAQSDWRIGGGEVSLRTLTADKKRISDLLPMHEQQVVWNEGKGKVQEKQSYLLPATSLKGALRHRVAYHYNCLMGNFVDKGTCSETDENKAVTTLFGFAQNDKAQAGIILLRDIYITEQKVQEVMHNKIDRYTGGVINGALFSEETLYKTVIHVQLEVINPKQEIDSQIKQALSFALEDLAQGWLPIGASGSRGLGVFLSNTGVEWSDQKQWLSLK